MMKYWLFACILFTLAFCINVADANGQTEEKAENTSDETTKNIKNDDEAKNTTQKEKNDELPDTITIVSKKNFMMKYAELLIRIT